MDDYVRKGKKPQRKFSFMRLGLLIAVAAIAIGSAYFLLSGKNEAAVAANNKPTAGVQEKELVKPDTKQIENKPVQSNDKEKSAFVPEKENLATNTAGVRNYENKKWPAADHKYSIFIKKGEFMVYLLDNGKPVKNFPCALGKGIGQKEKRGDMKTPTGTFTVDEICDASYWTHDFGDGKGEIKGAYGNWFISLDTQELSQGKWDGIGIHGTHDPQSIGTRASEGCIRLYNDSIDELKQHSYVGMKVVIEE